MKRLILGIIFFIFIGTILPVFQKAHSQESEIPINTISLAQGEQKILSFDLPLERVNITTKGIVNIFTKDPSSIVLRGQAPGSTKILFQHTNGEIKELNVVVLLKSPAELKNLSEQLKIKLAPIKGIEINLTEDKIILSGEIDDKFDPYYQQIVGMYCDVIVDLIKGYSCGKTPAYGTEENNAIQIDVQVLEINRENALDLGFEWFPSKTPVTVRALSKSDSSQGAPDADSTPYADIKFGAFDAQVVNLQANIIALANKGKARFLSNPKLIVQSGEEASFSVGGEIPIAQNNAVNSSVDWKQYGTQLKISPKVMDADKISVHLNALVSELDYQNKISNYPAIRNKEAETNVIIKEGATLAIAGLVSEDKTNNISKVPLLGDIPLLGYVFKRKTNKIVYKETIIFLTPHIIKKQKTPSLTSGPKGVIPSSEMQGAVDEVSSEASKAVNPKSKKN